MAHGRRTIYILASFTLIAGIFTLLLRLGRSHYHESFYCPYCFLTQEYEEEKICKLDLHTELKPQYSQLSSLRRLQQACTHHLHHVAGDGKNILGPYRQSNINYYPGYTWIYWYEREGPGDLLANVESNDPPKGEVYWMIQQLSESDLGIKLDADDVQVILPPDMAERFARWQASPAGLAWLSADVRLEASLPEPNHPEATP